MNDLKISPDFSVEDIHKVREYNYERRQTMSETEIQKEIADSMKWFNVEMQKRKEVAV